MRAGYESKLDLENRLIFQLILKLKNIIRIKLDLMEFILEIINLKK